MNLGGGVVTKEEIIYIIKYVKLLKSKEVGSSGFIKEINRKLNVID